MSSSARERTRRASIKASKVTTTSLLFDRRVRGGFDDGAANVIRSTIL